MRASGRAVVVLDTLELALVQSANPDATALSRPIVRLLFDPRGNPVADAPVADLTAKDGGGQYLRTIIRTEDPERYGVRVADFFT